MLFTFEDMFPFLIIFLFVVQIKTDDKVKSLCEDPIIHAADRLPNNTYRVYRDSHYWTLTGLPDRVTKVDGPFKIPFQYMAPLQGHGSIMTIGSGALSGHTYKFFEQNYWHWFPNGTLWLEAKGERIGSICLSMDSLVL